MKKQKVLCIPLHTSRAGHSKMMEPFLKAHEQFAGQLQLNQPQIPYISNLTGHWMTGTDAVDPTYWSRHFRETVRFADGIRELVKIPGAVFIEIGPGRDLSALVVRHIENNPDLKTLYLARSPGQKISDQYFLLNRMGRLWLWGVTIDWEKFHAGEKTRRISLPTYPFERQRFWIDADLSKINAAAVTPHTPAFEPPVSLEKPGAPPVTGTISPRPDVETQYLPPRDETEQKMAHTWAQFFGFERIGIDDDFFELGGDSLKALKVLSEINKELEIELPVTEFIRKPTIRNLASLAADKAREKQFLDNMFGVIAPGQIEDDLRNYVEQPVVLLNRDTLDQNKLFCFPPGLAHGMAYKTLSAVLTNYSFYSFNFIEDLHRLKQYVEIITDRQPGGPYLLFAYSSGARLTFEVAKALEDRGFEVSDLILLDSLWPRKDFNPEVPGYLLNIIENYLEDLGVGYLKQRVLARVKEYRRYFTARTRPKKVNANVHVILSQENKLTPGAGGWAPFTTKKYSTYRGAGSHDEMLAPGFIRKNANIIKKILKGRNKNERG